ncbi:MAG: TonB family protein [Pseudomonadota bacterium]
MSVLRPHPCAWALVVTGLLLTTTTALAQLEPQPTPFDEEPEAAAPTLTKPPVLLERHEPIYPAAAIAESREGEVVLQIEIGDDGLVKAATVVRSAGADLDQAAVDAARQLVFSPAEWDGEPGPIIIEYRQLFHLEAPAGPAAASQATSPPLSEVNPASLPINFEGLVREAGSKDALADVEVAVEIARHGGEGETELRTTLTDVEGRFALRGIPRGRHRVTFALTGYEVVEELLWFERDQRTLVKIHLTRRVTNKFTTVVRERREPTEVSHVSLSRDEVEKIPGTFGDPLRVLENLPGLARVGGIGGALIVRGANPEDTGVYFDGVQIPLLYHFGGLKSIVNPEFLEDIAFYPGGFGVQYGRATAGIVDVSSRELKMERFHGSADVNVMDTGFFFGGPVQLPLPVPTITIAAAGRRSYVDKLLPVVLDAVMSDQVTILASPVYWDYQLKAETRPASGQRFSIFAFGSADDLKVLGAVDEDRIRLGLLMRFHRVVMRHELDLGEKLHNTVQPYVGVDSNAIALSANEATVELTQDLYNWGLRDNLQWKPSEQVRFNYGLEYQGSRSEVAFNVPVPTAIEIGGFPRFYQRDFSEPLQLSATSFTHNLGLYLEGVFEPWSWVRLVPGVRVELLHDAWSEQGKVLADYGLWDNRPAYEVDLRNTDPRLALRLTPFAGAVLKAAVGLYRQPPASEDIGPDAANPFVDQPRALQLIIGFERRLLPQLLLDVQLYTTRRDQLVQHASRTSILNDRGYAQRWADNGGWGHTVGAEMLLRHEIHSYSLRGLGEAYRALLPGFYPEFLRSVFTEVGFFGWIAYTLSRTEIDLDPTRDALHLTDFDQTHILTIVAQANLPLGFTLGARFRLVSGNPTTLPNGSVHDLDYNEYVPQPSTTPARLPTFHQLDLRIDRTFVFDNFSLTPYLDLLNVYNQQNAEDYFTDYRNTTQEPLMGLPILPSLGMQGEF